LAAQRKKSPKKEKKEELPLRPFSELSEYSAWAADKGTGFQTDVRDIPRNNPVGGEKKAPSENLRQGVCPSDWGGVLRGGSDRLEKEEEN